MEQREKLLHRMYHLLERLDECAVNEDLDKCRMLNKYFSELDHVEFGLKNRGKLGSNFDRARNNYLMSLQKDHSGNYFMKEESLEEAREYLLKIKNHLKSSVEK